MNGTDAELKAALRMRPDVDYEDIRDAAQELDRRERLWRLYEAAIEPAPGVIHTASTRRKPVPCVLCKKQIRFGHAYCDGGTLAKERLVAHYECVPGLGVDREPWMDERDRWRAEALERSRIVGRRAGP